MDHRVRTTHARAWGDCSDRAIPARWPGRKASVSLSQMVKARGLGRGGQAGERPTDSACRPSTAAQRNPGSLSSPFVEANGEMSLEETKGAEKEMTWAAGWGGTRSVLSDTCLFSGLHIAQVFPAVATCAPLPDAEIMFCHGGERKNITPAHETSGVNLCIALQGVPRRILGGGRETGIPSSPSPPPPLVLSSPLHFSWAPSALCSINVRNVLRTCLGARPHCSSYPCPSFQCKIKSVCKPWEGQ